MDNTPEKKTRGRTRKYNSHEEYLEARKLKIKEWKEKNKEKTLNYHKEYYQKNKDKMKNQISENQKKKRKGKTDELNLELTERDE
jgi:hypothetical protein